MPRGERQNLISGADAATFGDSFRATRALTEALVRPLSDADASLQSMEDASPAKWHLAHTTWFWEMFLLRDYAPGYRLWREDWPFLFNSYYEAEGARMARGQRGMLSRPTLTEVCEWRAAVNDAMTPLLDDPALSGLIALGVAHEQQHIELLLTDIKHALFQNPLGPAMYEAVVSPREGGDLRQNCSDPPEAPACAGVHSGSVSARDQDALGRSCSGEDAGAARRLSAVRDVADGELQRF